LVGSTTAKAKHGKAAIDGDIATEMEYAIAGTINVLIPYYAYHSVAYAIYDVQKIEARTWVLTEYNINTDFFNDSNFGIINIGMYRPWLEAAKIKTPIIYEKLITIMSYENYLDVNKICDLDDVIILTWKK